jgi:hypothetical protein
LLTTRLVTARMRKHSAVTQAYLHMKLHRPAVRYNPSA